MLKTDNLISEKKQRSKFFMEVNILGLIATALFIIIPTAFF